MKPSPSDLEFIHEAAGYLENPGFAMRVTHWLGKPLEKSLELLPEAARQQIALGSHKALQGCLKAALFTLEAAPSPAMAETVPDPRYEDGEKLRRQATLVKMSHGLATAVTGAIGGALGLPGIAFELPISTTLMFRGIASIARANGVDLSSAENQLDCLSVFSMGSPEATGRPRTPSGKAPESSYFTQRIAMAQMISEAMTFVGRATAGELAEAMARQTAPALVRFVTRLAGRFEVVVSQKTLAQLVPLVGAGSGALINTAFNEHFSTVAGYHFGLRRLERRHGAETIRALYQAALAV